MDEENGKSLSTMTLLEIADRKNIHSQTAKAKIELAKEYYELMVDMVCNALHSCGAVQSPMYVRKNPDCVLDKVKQQFID